MEVCQDVAVEFRESIAFEAIRDGIPGAGVYFPESDTALYSL